MSSESLGSAVATAGAMNWPWQRTQLRVRCSGDRVSIGRQSSSAAWSDCVSANCAVGRLFALVESLLLGADGLGDRGRPEAGLAEGASLKAAQVQPELSSEGWQR